MPQLTPNLYVPLGIGLALAMRGAKRKRLPRFAMGAVLGFIGLNVARKYAPAVDRYLPTLGA